MFAYSSDGGVGEGRMGACLQKRGGRRRYEGTCVLAHSSNNGVDECE